MQDHGRAAENSVAPRLLFAVMSLVWGLTWIAIKTGVAAVPPLFFAGTRFVAAGILLLAWERIVGNGSAGPHPAIRREDWPKLLVATLLMIVATYALLFWGTAHVASGLASVINLSLTPVALFGIGLAYREERFSARRMLGIAVGIIGLAVLFRPTGGGRDRAELWGMAAIIGGSIAYSWGSVLTRKLLRLYSPVRLSGITTLLGGLALTGIALLVEPVDRSTLAAFAAPGIAASWLFLVLFGSLVAFTVYLRLVRDWGASRAGLYAFVSPAIAVAVGVMLAGEALHASDLAGMLIMLAATGFAMRGAPAAPAKMP
jgi:drug/metabolite transporter (DMT)-like permease